MRSVTIISAGVAVIAACCIDSTGFYGYVSGVICIAGITLAITSYCIEHILREQRKRRKKQFYEARRKDRLDADIEFMEVG